MELKTELQRIVGPDRVLTRTLDRIAFANDASVYRLVPRAVVLAESVEEIRCLLRFSRQQRIPLTFRAAGTSLSGQAVTDGILVVASRHWRKIRVEQDGKRVRVQPGVIGGVVNRHLKPYGTKIGPDPASISACMMGGILANNSSGMCCGVVNNAYHTLESIHFVLPSGLELNSEAPDAEQKLVREAPDLARGLVELKRQVESNEALAERIRAKYRMKNTMGYSLNAFLDYSRPLDILAHLMIGSEGTLGFIAEAVLRTIPDDPLKYTGLLFFRDVPSACAAIAALRDSGARALELMDRASLRSIEDQPGVPPVIRDLSRGAAALLVEYQCATDHELEQAQRACGTVLPTLPLASEPAFTTDAAQQDALWRVRKGLIPSVGAMRERGTSFIIEDVVFPVERLARGVRDLQQLFAEQHYDDAIVFGHAKDGNLHFVLTQAFDEPSDVERYDTFMRQLATVVVGRHGGALKAEHGTGRNMAPFVATEWGDDALEIMRRLKRLADPDGRLNPGVILNEDPRAHVTDLKDLPTVESEVDHCIECGFCERVCPSRDLTLTPRQRIVVRREMARLREAHHDSPLLHELEADYAYSAVDTCATDGMCATACPVSIDTGKLVKRLRRENASDAAQEVASLLAERFGLVERAARLALGAGSLVRSVLGNGAGGVLDRAASRLLGFRPPPGGPGLPRAAGALPRTPRHAAAAVYVPSCVSRVLGPVDGRGPSSRNVDALVAVAGRAGVPVWIPDDVRGHCCGMPFSSKGYPRAYRHTINRTIEAFWRWSQGGRLPVVMDTSPCAYTLKQARADLTPANRTRFDRMRVVDSIEFALELVLPALQPRRLDSEVVLHPVCSVVKMNFVDPLRRVAEACVARAVIPPSAGCCGFAGDRGFSVPELTAAATRAEAAEVNAGSYQGYYSSSPTCEMALSRATGHEFVSFWVLLEQATR